MLSLTAALRKARKDISVDYSEKNIYTVIRPTWNQLVLLFNLDAG